MGGNSSVHQDQELSVDSRYTEHQSSEFRSKTQPCSGTDPRASERLLVSLRQGILGQEMLGPSEEPPAASSLSLTKLLVAIVTQFPQYF